MVTPENLKLLLKQHHWTIAITTSGKQNVYAAKRRRGQKLVTCYIGTANKLNSLTEEEIVAKLNYSVPPTPANQKDAGSENNHHKLDQKIGLVG